MLLAFTYFLLVYAATLISTAIFPQAATFVFARDVAHTAAHIFAAVFQMLLLL